MSKVYDIVTKQVCDMLAKGTVPWQKPWRPNALTCYNIMGYTYRGINSLLLGILSYDLPVFLTFNQINKLGGKIKKDEGSHPVYFFTWVKKTDAKGDESKFPIFRFTKVWNIAQVDGIDVPKRIMDKINQNKVSVVKPLEAADTIVAQMQNAPKIKHCDTDVACYFPTLDVVNMPMTQQFNSTAGYYATLFHELGHSTGHESRLNRKEITNGIWREKADYSLEELVAEFTSTFLCAETGIDNTMDNSAAYIASWSKALRNDPKMIVTAAARAQKAVDYILNRTEEKETAEV